MQFVKGRGGSHKKEHDVSLHCYTPSSVSLKETPTALLLFKDKDKESAPPEKLRKALNKLLMLFIRKLQEDN